MILIGTHHFDIEGPKRLEHLLEQIKPKTIAIEASRKVTLEEVENHSLTLKKSFVKIAESREYETPLLKQYIVEYFSVHGYEVSISANYAKRNSVQIIPVDVPMNLVETDDDSVEDLFESVYQRLVTWMNNETRGILSQERPYTEIRDSLIEELDKRDYGELTGFFKKDYMGSGPRLSLGGMVREESMAKKVLEVNSDLFIGGFWHVFAKSGAWMHEELEMRLEGNIERIKLCDAFKYQK